MIPETKGANYEFQLQPRSCPKSGIDARLIEYRQAVMTSLIQRGFAGDKFSFEETVGGVVFRTGYSETLGRALSLTIFHDLEVVPVSESAKAFMQEVEAASVPAKCGGQSNQLSHISLALHF